MSTLRKVYLTAAFLLALSCVVLLAKDAEADLIYLKEVSITYREFLPGSTDPLLSQVNVNAVAGINLNLDCTIGKVLYFNNTVHSLMDGDLSSAGGQFRAVGWEYSLGAHITKELDLGIYHYSEHLLDISSPVQYPQVTGVQLKIYLYNANRNDTVL